MQKFKLNSSSVLAAILLLCAVFSSCDNWGTNYVYKWKAKVTYTNGQIDTVSYEYKSFKGNEAHTYLKVSENGLLSSAGTTPCLIVGCGFRQDVVVCDVRKYEILQHSRVLVK